MDRRDAIQRIALEWPSYGRPRVTRELRRRGWTVNPKRVCRLLRKDNLLCVRRRRFVVTTDSNHTRKIYPNLAPNLILTATDQLWRADITYIRLRDEFVFLAVILDAYPRRVIGWALDRTLEDELTLTALGMALARRVVQPGLVHHSDRGSQYASNDYTELLTSNGIAISMSRKGNPWDNAACESFMKTLKYEQVHRNEYRGLAEARASIHEFLDLVYNHKRLHSALGYVPPAEFEANLAARDNAAQNNKDAAARQLPYMSFRRHREIYPSNGGASRKADAPAQRVDEFPAGYSLAGCSPAQPASASPSGSQYALQSSCRARDFQRTANCVLTLCVRSGGRRKGLPRFPSWTSRVRSPSPAPFNRFQKT